MAYQKVSLLMPRIQPRLAHISQTSSCLCSGAFHPQALCLFHQAEYANKLCYIATLTLAKLSIISLLMILTASSLHRKFGWVLTAFIALWGIVTEFVAAFQCGAQNPWQFLSEEAQCLSMVCQPTHRYIMLLSDRAQAGFWRSFGALNIITDLCLICFPVHVIFTLQMSVRTKITILGFFGARSL